MKKLLSLSFGLSLFLFACSSEPKPEESANKDGINIQVSDDSTNAKVNISEDGINVKTEDGKEADVHIGKDGIHVKGEDGEEADIKMNGESMDIKTKDGETKVKMDKSGNMNIKTPDGKEINVNVKEAADKK